MHEIEKFPLEFPPLLVLFWCTLALGNVLDILLDTTNAIFKIFEFSLEFLFLSSFRSVFLGRTIEEIARSRQLSFYVFEFGVSTFTLVPNGVSIDMTTG
jgi:hypothetical protein